MNSTKKICELRYEPIRKSNQLARAAHALSAREQKLMTFICSLIKPKTVYGEVPSDYTPSAELNYEIDLNLFCDVCGIDRNGGANLRDIKDLLKTLSDKSIWINKNNEQVLVRWINKPIINTGSNVISITLDKDIAEHLLVLSEYLSYPFYNVLTLDGSFSIHLYEILRSWAGTNHYTDNKLYTIEELKYMLGCDKDFYEIDTNGKKTFGRDYPNFHDFEKRVLKPAVEEISRLTDLNVSYIKECNGPTKKVTHVRFVFKRRSEQMQVVFRERAIAKLNGEDISSRPLPPDPTTVALKNRLEHFETIKTKKHSKKKAKQNKIDNLANITIAEETFSNYSTERVETMEAQFNDPEYIAYLIATRLDSEQDEDTEEV